MHNMIYNEITRGRSSQYIRRRVMKKLLFVAFAAVLGVAACSSANTNTKTADGRTVSSKETKDAKYQIIDQEFDNLLAPDADYDAIPDYELQACGDSYLPPATTVLKGATKPAAKKPVKKAAKKASSQSAAKTEENTSSTNVTTTKKVINNTNIYYLDGSSPNTSSSNVTTTTYTSEEALPPADMPDTL